MSGREWKTQMRFFVCRDDLAGSPREDGGSRAPLSEFTSVEYVKRDFIEHLRSMGELSVIEESTHEAGLVSALQQADTFFAAVHLRTQARALDNVPKRVIFHSLGSLMVPDDLLRVLYFLSDALVVTTTDAQAERLHKHLGAAAPRLATFVPRVDETFFRPPSEEERRDARTALDLIDQQRHIVYVGRWLATKGISQLQRCLSLWPVEKTRVTLVGSYQPEFRLRTTSASHRGFREFLQGEVARAARYVDLRMRPPMTREGLRTLLWSADVAVFASVHEDENFCLASREAALCGVPVVATDFGGLAPIADAMPWGGIPTYPAAVGVRFSLWELRLRIASALEAGRDSISRLARGYAQAESDPANSRWGLLHGIRELGEREPRAFPNTNEAVGLGLSRVLTHASPRFVASLFANRTSSPPPGCFPWGCGPYAPEYPTNELFRQTQAMCTTCAEPPPVVPGTHWRGFFRVAICRHESAVVEVGFPGPRVLRVEAGDLEALEACASGGGVSGELMFQPRTEHQCELIANLVDLGYLVPDRELPSP